MAMNPLIELHNVKSNSQKSVRGGLVLILKYWFCNIIKQSLYIFCFLAEFGIKIFQRSLIILSQNQHLKKIVCKSIISDIQLEATQYRCRFD